MQLSVNVAHVHLHVGIFNSPGAQKPRGRKPFRGPRGKIPESHHKVSLFFIFSKIHSTKHTLSVLHEVQLIQ